MHRIWEVVLTSIRIASAIGEEFNMWEKFMSIAYPAVQIIIADFKEQYASNVTLASISTKIS
jgi:hypothetical protein